MLGRVLHAVTRFPRLQRVAKAGHAGVYRLTRGRLMGRWFGSPVLVLETVGRKTGRRRRTPMTYCSVDGAWIVTPINAGSTRTPAWWLNLSAAGRGTVILRGRRIPVTPRAAEGDERERLWGRYVAEAPVLEQFRGYAQRDVPVVVLEHDGPPSAAPPRATR